MGSHSLIFYARENDNDANTAGVSLALGPS